MADEHFGTIADFFVNGPLYKKVSVEITVLGNRDVKRILPAEVERECERCNQVLRWDRTIPADWFEVRFAAEFADLHSRGPQLSQMQFDEFSSVTYRCRNCGQATLRVWFYLEADTRRQPLVTVLSFTKVGHYPQFQTSPPAALRKALDKEHLAFYRGAKTLRHHGYGIGALVYFRRLVEDLANEMLDLLIEMLRETGGDRDAIERVRQAKGGTVFQDKAKVAAEALPTSLRPGGINPFTVLYDMPSEGLHRLSDEECCAIVDRVDTALQFIYVELKGHVEERRAFVEALKGLSKTGKPTPP